MLKESEMKNIQICQVDRFKTFEELSMQSSGLTFDPNNNRIVSSTCFLPGTKGGGLLLLLMFVWVTPCMSSQTCNVGTASFSGDEKWEFKGPFIFGIKFHMDEM